MAYEYESQLESELEDEFEDELEDESEGELEGELEDEAVLEGEGWLGTLGNLAGSLLGESEDEYEDEFEGEYELEDELEGEGEISPIRKIYADAMMEHLGELASEAESEEEAAEHFLPLVGMAASKLLPVVARAVAPMARRALPKIAKALTHATPRLTRSIGKVAKVLHRNPQTRHLLKAVPGIARRTVGNIAHAVARGKHISPQTAVRTLVRHTRRVLGTPQHRAQALRRHHHLERRFHGQIGRGGVRPHVPQGRPGTRHYGRHVHPGRGIAYGKPGVARRRYGTSVPGTAPGVAVKSGSRRVVHAPGAGTACPVCGAPAAARRVQVCHCCGQRIP